MKNFIKNAIGVGLAAIMAFSAPASPISVDITAFAAEASVKAQNITFTDIEGKKLSAVYLAPGESAVVKASVADCTVTSDNKNLSFSLDEKDKSIITVKSASNTATGVTEVKVSRTENGKETAKGVLKVSVDKYSDVPVDERDAFSYEGTKRIYVNGTKYTENIINEKTGKKEKKVTDYKTFTADVKLPIPDGAELLAYVSLDKNDRPGVRDGKLMGPDNASEAKNYATAKVNKAKGTDTLPSITVTSAKKPGTVYVWAVVEKNDRIVSIASMDVTVLGAPKTVLAFENGDGITRKDGAVTAIDSSKAVKKDTIQIGDTVSYEFLGFVDVSAKDTSSFVLESAGMCSYEVSLDSKSAAYLTVDDSRLKDGIVKISASEPEYSPLRAKVNAKVTIKCKESGKSAVLSLVIVDEVKRPVGDEKPKGVVFPSADALYQIPNPTADKQTLYIYGVDVSRYSSERALYTIYTEDGTDSATFTDKVTVAVAENTEGSWSCDGKKVSISGKPKGISAKIDKNTATITITASKGATGSFKLLVIVTHEDKTVEAYERVITVANSSTYLKIKKNIIKAPLFGSTSIEVELGGGKGNEQVVIEELTGPMGATFVKGVAAADSKKKPADKITVSPRKMGNHAILVKYGDRVEPVIIQVTAPKNPSLSVKGSAKLAVGETLVLDVKASGGTLGNEKIEIYNIGQSYVTAEYNGKTNTISLTGIKATEAKKPAMIHVRYGYVLKSIKVEVTDTAAKT